MGTKVLNKRFAFFCAMLAFILVPEPLPIGATLAVGLIKEISGWKYALYAIGIELLVYGYGWWTSMFGIADSIDTMMKVIWNRELAGLIATVGLPTFEKVLATNHQVGAAFNQLNFILWVFPYFFSVLMTVSLPLLCIPLWKAWFWKHPRTTRRLREIGRSYRQRS